VFNFVITGTVDSGRVQAVYGNGLLMIDSPLMDRARLMVALGDTFELGDSEVIAAAVSGEPLAMFLTFLRACDDPVSVEVVTEWQPSCMANDERCA